MPGKRIDFRFGRDIPNIDVVIVAISRKPIAVGTKGDFPSITLVRNQNLGWEFSMAVRTKFP